MQHVERALMRVKEANVKSKLGKCKFAQRTVKYLGHVVDEGRRKQTVAKIRALKKGRNIDVYVWRVPIQGILMTMRLLENY